MGAVLYKYIMHRFQRGEDVLMCNRWAKTFCFVCKVTTLQIWVLKRTVCYFEDVFSNQKSLNFLKAQLQFINRYIKGQIFSVSSFTLCVCVIYSSCCSKPLWLSFLCGVSDSKKRSIWLLFLCLSKERKSNGFGTLGWVNVWKNFNFWVKYSFILWKAFVILAYWLIQEIILTCPSGTRFRMEEQPADVAGEIKSRNVKLVFFLNHESYINFSNLIPTHINPLNGVNFSFYSVVSPEVHKLSICFVGILFDNSLSLVQLLMQKLPTSHFRGFCAIILESHLHFLQSCSQFCL